MQPIPEILFRKICYIFHRGFVESRQLANARRDEQAHDLADAFEPMPGFLPEWSDENLALIRSHLESYQNKYGPSAFDYIAILDMDNDKFGEVLSRW